MTRIRSIDGDYHTGTLVRDPPVSISITNTCRLKRDWVEDTPGPGDGQYFLVHHYQHDTGCIANGSIPPRHWGDFPLGAFLLPNAHADHVPVSIPPYSALAAQLLASTSPNAPSIDLPVYLYELRDMKEIFQFCQSLKRQMRKGLVNEALGKLAAADLTWEFGLRPLLKDIRTLMNFDAAIAKKLDELNNLKRSGLRRKRHLFRGQGEQQIPKFVAESGTSYLIYYTGIANTNVQVSGFVKWFPTGNFRQISDEKMRGLASSLALGLNVDIATLWQAMPWSWLADWCTNIGDLLEAYRHGVPVTHTTPQIMVLTETERRYSNGNAYPGILPEHHVRKHTTKSRVPASAFLTAYMPFLSGRQVAILGSLTVLKNGNIPRFRALAGNG